MKNVLVVYYSQSGQLERIGRTIASPLVAAQEVNVYFYEIRPVHSFPFPWNKESFFGAFPDSFLENPHEVEPIKEDLLSLKFDLILFCYQVWYLSPSIPVTSFLKSSQVKLLFQDVPVVTISGSRNMWIMAQEKIKSLLVANGAKLVGNIALVDKSPNLVSVITIVEWMMSGIKRRYLGFFPLPGVSDNDISNSERFGETILESLQQGSFSDLQLNLVRQDAVNISPYLVTVDKTANRIFSKWSNFIVTKKSSRSVWLKVFYIYLLLAIWIASPIVYVLHLILYPFRLKKIKHTVAYYQGV